MTDTITFKQVRAADLKPGDRRAGFAIEYEIKSVEFQGDEVILGDSIDGSAEFYDADDLVWIVDNSDTEKVCVLCGAPEPAELAENEAGNGYEPMCIRCWNDETEAHPYG